MAQPAAKRQRTPSGYKQQALWRAADEAADGSGSSSAESALANLLISKWAWGEMSTPLIQQIAQAASRDGLRHPSIQVIAKLGTSGRHPNHMHKELLNKLTPTPIADTLSQFEVTFDNEKLTQHVLWPHELKHYDIFEKNILGGTRDNVGKFWNSVARQSQYKNHPIRKRANHRERCIPVALHGDGVTFSGVSRTWSKSIDAYSWSSCLSVATGIDHNFLIYLFLWAFGSNGFSKKAWQQWSKKLAWSFYWMMVGKWPTRGEDDKPITINRRGNPPGSDLAGGYYAALWLIRGDLEHMYKAYNLAYYGSGSPCCCCDCNSSDRPWTDGRLKQAAWMKTIWTNATFAARHPEVNHLLKMPGVGIEAFRPDYMHTLHLGVYQYVFGSVLILLTHFIMPRSRDKNLNAVWDAIKEYYKVVEPTNGNRNANFKTCSWA